MIYEKDYDRNAETVNVDYKYKDKYKQHKDVMKGEGFSCEIILAQETIQHKEGRNGGSYDQEVIGLVLKLTKSNEWFKVNLKGATYKKDGTRGRSPVQLHDFMQMALAQRPNALDDSSVYDGDYGRITTYPNLTGLKFKLVIARTGTFNGNAVHEFELYDEHGFSIPEIEAGAKEPKDIYTKLTELKGKYEEFVKGKGANSVVSTASSSSPYGRGEVVVPQVATPNSVVPNSVAPNTVAPEPVVQDNDDDMPF